MNHSFFMPHGWCMTWNPRLIWLTVATDGLVALSYYSIPAALFFLAWKRRLSIPVQPLLILFGLFIALCGGGHAIDIASIWKPIYWVKAWWNVGTATASVITAIVLIPRTLEFINMPGRAERLEHEASKLREESSLLGTVLDSVDEAILLLDDKGTTLLRNRAAREVVPEEAAAWISGASPVASLWLSPIGAHIERLQANVPGYGRLYVFRDLTEKFRAEQTRLRLERIISSMKQGFEVISLSSEEIVQTNPSFDKMHGADQGSMLGRPAQSIFAGTPEVQSRVFRNIREMCEASAFWEGETLHVSDSGAEFWCSSRFNLHDESGHRFLSALHNDISDQKRAAEESARVQARLREAAKLESLGVLAGGIAHDFNNLLVGILGNATVAMETVPKEGAVKNMLKDIVAASESAATLTRQLLAYAGKGRFVVEPVELSALIRQITPLIHTSIPKGVEITLNLQKGLSSVEADVGQIQQLVMNMVINAAEAIGARSGRVIVTTAMQDVDEQYVAEVLAPEQIAPGRYVSLEVQDNGSGMSTDTLARIFDPFFTTKFTGRGLGLAAVLGIARGHRGAIKVYTVLGEGTTFKVLLPASHQEMLPPPRPLVARAAPLTGAVLVIDDEPFVRRTAKAVLQRYGYTVHLAENGKEGVETFLAMQGQIALVLMDMTMPVMSGAETFREIHNIDPNTPIILSSGFNEVEAVQRFTGTGLAGFIQKPYSAVALIEKIRAVTEERTEQEAVDT